MLSECSANSAFLVKCHSEITGFPRLRDEWERQLRCEGHQLGIGWEAFGVAIDTSSTDISHIQQYKTISVLARQLGVSNHFPSTALGARLCHGQYLIPFPKPEAKKKQAIYRVDPLLHYQIPGPLLFHIQYSDQRIVISALCPLQVFLVVVVEALKHRLKNAITKLHIQYTLFQFIYLYSHINI